MIEIYKKIKGLLLTIFSCGLVLQGCNVINPSEPVPTYIHIDSFHFAQNAALKLTNLATGANSNELAPTSSQVNVAWVYYNNNPVGIFDLPVTFPVITNGTVGQLDVYAGIKADGQNNDIINYPFYMDDTFSFAARPGQTINFNPKIQFYSGVTLGIISNFEDNQTHFASANPGVGSIGFTPQHTDSTFEGQHSGMIALYSPTVDSAVDSTNFSFPIPAGRAYIEFDYNSTVPFYVGLQANLSNFISSIPTYLTGIYPNSGWEKFYLEVDGFTGAAQGTSYNFYIKAVLSPGQTSGRLLIDNIILVTN